MINILIGAVLGAIVATLVIANNQTLLDKFKAKFKK